jgi:hypothetical protein
MYLRCLFALVMLTIPADLSTRQLPGYAPLLADLHQAKGLSCAACHKESPPKSAVPDQVCVACHGGVPEIIARGNNYAPNPHISPHSADLRCATCHHAHKSSEVSCLACHADKTFIRQ